MTAANLAELLTPEAESGDWETVKHLYGEILEAEILKTKAGQSRKTTTKALLYVRWDEDLYEDGDEGAESWLEVIPIYYGMDGKNGWVIVLGAKDPSMKLRSSTKSRTWSPATTAMGSRARETAAAAAAAVTVTAMPVKAKAKAKRSRSRSRTRGPGRKGKGRSFFFWLWLWLSNFVTQIRVLSADKSALGAEVERWGGRSGYFAVIFGCFWCKLAAMGTRMRANEAQCQVPSPQRALGAF